MQRTIHTASGLPLRAEKLLGILKVCIGQNEDCWPSMAWLAGELGVSVRVAQNWVAYLAAAGRIDVRRTGRQNRYSIPRSPAPNREITRAEISASEALKSAHQRRCFQRIRGAEISASEALISAPNGLPPLDENESIQQHQEGDAAAAGALRSKEDVLRDLDQLDLPAMHRRPLEEDASLAAAILEHCRFRFGPCRLKSIANKPGYLVRCIKEPLAVGFTRDADGRWRAPAGQPPRPKAGQGSKDRLEQIEAVRAERAAENERRLDEESRRRERWFAAPEAVKAEIRRLARERYPLFLGKDDESLTFVSTCMILLESRGS